MKIILPEQATLAFTTANFGSRALAYSIDFVLRWLAVAVIYLLLLIAVSQLDNVLTFFADMSEYFRGITFVDHITAFLLALVLFLGFVFSWAYTIFFEVKYQGVTPGKRAIGLRVVDEAGLPITFRASLLRTIFTLVDLLPALGIVALVSMLVSKNHRRIGDMVASTYVIHDLAPTGLLSEEPIGVAPTAVPVSPELLAVVDATYRRRNDLEPGAIADLVQQVISRLGGVLSVEVVKEINASGPKGQIELLRSNLRL